MTSFLLSRRRMLAASALGAISAPAHNALAASELPRIESYRNPRCGCCEQWVRLLQRAGFAVAMSDDPQLNARKRFSVCLCRSRDATYPWSATMY